MAQFEYITLWRIEAALESVWHAIHTVREYPTWWPFVAEVIEIDSGDENGHGAVHRFRWKTRLPYTLSFVSKAVRVEKPKLIEATVDGELVGRGVWRIREANGHTIIRHEWHVSARKTWMSILAPLARPAFKWNHAAVMHAGGEGLARHLGTRLLDKT